MAERVRHHLITEIVNAKGRQSILLFRVSGLWTLLAILVALAGALSATVRLLTWFAVYDDEGYMLVSLAHYINEGHLYTQTLWYYGPFYFYAQGIFFQLLRLPVTHDMGRLVTLVYWASSSLLATVFVYRLSKSTFLACAAAVCSMLVGSVLTNEPGHPQQVVLLLYMSAACLSLPSQSGRYLLRLFLLGCIGAALAFTKVNVGVFYIAGLAHALLCLLPSGRRVRSIGIGLTLICAATFPWLLMHASFNHGFVGYCLLATVSGVVTFACGALIRPQQSLPMRAALCSAGRHPAFLSFVYYLHGGNTVSGSVSRGWHSDRNRSRSNDPLGFPLYN